MDRFFEIPGSRRSWFKWLPCAAVALLIAGIATPSISTRCHQHVVVLADRPMTDVELAAFLKRLDAIEDLDDDGKSPTAGTIWSAKFRVRFRLICCRAC